MQQLLPISALLIALVMPLNSMAQSNPPPAADNAAAEGSGNELVSHFVQRLKGHLIRMEDGNPVEVDTASLKGIKYWAFYHSASWCGPCKILTPQLVKFYNAFKKIHPSFELVFVSADQDEAAMLDYMKDDQMPWPAVKFDDVERPSVVPTYLFGEGIPCLVFTDGEGRILASTHQDGVYSGPGPVVDMIEKVVPQG